MNTVPYPKPRSPKDKLAEYRLKRAMARTRTLLLKLGFKAHLSTIDGYIMPEYPGPVLIVSKPLETIDEVITAVFAWGYREGAADSKRKIREALDMFR